MKRRYNFDIIVASADELAGIGTKIDAFMTEMGEFLAQEVDVNVSIGQAQQCPINTHAIGFAVYNEDDEMEDEE